MNELSPSHPVSYVALLLTGIALMFATSAIWYVVSANDKYADRLEAATNIIDPWERYRALNHDWSPGAWCRRVSDDSDTHARWADETAAALLAALKARDARAIAYLHSEEARWYCLNELRAQYPKDSAR